MASNSIGPPSEWPGAVEFPPVGKTAVSWQTFCHNANIPQRVIDTWMGHTGDRSMGSVYYRLSDEDSRRFMKSVPF